MPVATRRELLEAGVHFGHQTRRWNPKMGRFIFGERSGIYIVDLEKTLSGLKEAWDFLVDVGRRGGAVVFVGTKKQAQTTVAEQATRVGMPYVNTRWLGGMLTNFQTIYGRLKRLKELREMERSGAFDFLPKKEVLKLRHEKEKLERNLSGIQDMERPPDAIFVIDTKKEHIAVTEARKLGIPVVAIVDTNCDPDEVDYVIPGNDDAIRACSLIARVVADALQEGQYLAYQGMQSRAVPEDLEEPPAPASLEPAAEQGESRKVQLSEEEAAFFGSALEGGTESAEVAEPEGDAEPAVDGQGSAEVPPATSASWGAPPDPSDLEAATTPAEAGAESTEGEAIEAELDRAPGSDRGEEPGRVEEPDAGEMEGGSEKQGEDEVGSPTEAEEAR